MFSKKDIENIKKSTSEVPDGLVDTSDTHHILEQVVDIMSNTDYLEDESRMQMMMNCINICYEESEDDDEPIMSEDKVLGVIIALTFCYANVMSNLVSEGFDASNYFDFVKQEILPVMEEEAKILPYWDLDNE